MLCSDPENSLGEQFSSMFLYYCLTMHHLLAAHLAGDVVQLGPDVVLVKRVVLAVLKESIFTGQYRQA